jgi:hypothetical protein
MVLHCPFGDEQPPGDFPVGQAFGQQGKNFLLAGCQSGWSSPCGWARPARDRLDPEFLHPSPGHGGGRLGVQFAERCQGMPEPGLI